MAGSVIDAMALLMAVGNRISGRAIPVSTPYIRRESFVLMPNTRSCMGMDTASILCRILRSIRLAVNGMDNAVSSFRELRIR